MGTVCRAVNVWRRESRKDSRCLAEDDSAISVAYMASEFVPRDRRELGRLWERSSCWCGGKTGGRRACSNRSCGDRGTGGRLVGRRVADGGSAHARSVVRGSADRESSHGRSAGSGSVVAGSIVAGSIVASSISARRIGARSVGARMAGCGRAGDRSADDWTGDDRAADDGSGRRALLVLADIQGGELLDGRHLVRCWERRHWRGVRGHKVVSVGDFSFAKVAVGSWSAKSSGKVGDGRAAL